MAKYVTLLPDYDFLRKSMLAGLESDRTLFIVRFGGNEEVLHRTKNLLFNITNALNAVDSEEALQEVQDAVAKTLSVINEALRKAQKSL